MAWDHSRDEISDGLLPVDRGSEQWAGPLATYDNNFGLFLQRWLPHFCAPGFFWLMGVGMALFHTSRLAKFASGEWSNRRLVKHFVLRGALLIVMDRVVNIPAYVTQINRSNYLRPFTVPGSNPAWQGLLSIFEVLTALGFSMIFCGLLLPVLAWVSQRVRWVRRGVLIITSGQILAILLGFLAFVVSNAVIVHYQGADPVSAAYGPFPASASEASSFSEYLTRFTVVPGAFPQGFILYPVLPWIALTLWGLAAGYFLVSPLGRDCLPGFLIVQGSVCWSLFLLIRFIGGPVGNLRGWGRSSSDPPRGSVQFYIAFLDVCKYPPSFAYAMLTLGGCSFACVVLGQALLFLHRGARKRDAAIREAQRLAGFIAASQQQFNNSMRAAAELYPDGTGTLTRDPYAPDSGSEAELTARTPTSPLSSNGRSIAGGIAGAAGSTSPRLVPSAAEQHRVWNLDHAASPPEVGTWGRAAINGAATSGHARVSSSAGMVPPSPSHDGSFTVHMVRPAMSPLSPSSASADAPSGSSASSAAASDKPSCISLCCLSSTLNEFPLWHGFGRFLIFPLLTFGRVPLFFYVIHWYLLGAGAWFFHSWSDGLALAYVPLWWVGLITVMFFVCAPYARFKESRGPESLWRFL